MMRLCCDVVKALKGRTLATAESCTGGGIGAAITSVSGSSAVYKGGVISYTNEVKTVLLGVDPMLLDRYGAVSSPVAAAMAAGVRKAMGADLAVSVTGLAGPNGDGSDHPVGTVYIGFEDRNQAFVTQCHFIGNREEVRRQAVQKALEIILESLKNEGQADAQCH